MCPLFLIIVVGNLCIVLILWQIYSNLLGRRVVEVAVGEVLAQCGVVVEWEEWGAHFPTCEMAEETTTGGQDCLLHPAWGTATMTAMTVAMITTHRVVDHHQSCHHVTGDLSVLSVPVLKLFIYKWHVWLTFNPKEGLTCLTGNQKDDRTQTWCVPRMSVDPSLMLAEVLTNAHQCHQCPLLTVALTMVVHASPQTSIAEEHPHLRQVMEQQGEWTCFLVNFLFDIRFMKITETLMVMKAISMEVTNVKWCGHLQFISWKEGLLCWQYIYLDFADFREVVCGGYALLSVCVCVCECWY